MQYNAHLKDNAHRLRKNVTDSAAALWSRWRKKQLLGIQCYRQKAIGEHSVDCFAPRAQRVVEGDGSQHLGSDRALTDRRRDRSLVSLGLKVVRFHRREVLEERNAVVQAIDRTVAEQLSAQIPPGPPLIKGGEEEKDFSVNAYAAEGKGRNRGGGLGCGAKDEGGPSLTDPEESFGQHRQEKP